MCTKLNVDLMKNKVNIRQDPIFKCFKVQPLLPNVGPHISMDHVAPPTGLKIMSNNRY